ncbi:MAG: hypothetical protein EOP09_12450 [Proteobacteria bacterium]|nr:MAG: hypothetical protein EOP09_12450 [Pseudomonadota bacterium]
MKLWTYAIAALALFSVGSAQANTSLTGGNRFTGGLLLQDTGYDAENGDDSFDVEGTILVAGYKASVNPRFSIGGGFGLMVDGEAGSDVQADDGQGFRLFVDAAFEAHRFNNNKIIITGTVSHDRFGFEYQDQDVDFTVTELKAGALFMHSVEGFDLYGGLEFVLVSDGEVEVFNGDFDADRDDRLNLRLGAAYNLSNYVALKADLLILGEQTLLLGADFAL